MVIYSLQTARGGSKSVINKNMLNIEGKPLYKWNNDYSNQCPEIKKTFITTDIPDIIKNEKNVIIRPKELCGDHSSHYDTIIHGLKEIESIENVSVDILVVLLGNNRGAYTQDLSVAIKMLTNDTKADSIMSVGNYTMFNPYRAYKYNNGYVDTYIDQKITKKAVKSNHNNKDAYGEVYFFNGSFWVCRREAIIKNKGLLPFPWLGNNILIYEQEPYIMEIDSKWQITLLNCIENDK